MTPLLHQKPILTERPGLADLAVLEEVLEEVPVVVKGLGPGPVALGLP